MTTMQFATLMSAVREIGEKVDRIEERLAAVHPWEHEIGPQIERELEAILAPGGSIRVFADD